MIRFDRHWLSVLALSAAAALLIGCGQKGPLYLPESDIDSLAEGDAPGAETFDETARDSQVIGPTIDAGTDDSGSLIPRR